MDSIQVPVDGGELTVLRRGDGPNVILAAHGITGSGKSFTAVADRLPAGWTLLAPDLRGRGASTDVPGLPADGAESGGAGLHGHARDLGAIVEYVGGGPVVLAGHSMGAYVALLTAAARPELVSRLVLVDGGLPLPVPADADLDQVLAASLGPALERLSLTFASADAYVDFFREHPALGPHWNADVEAYVRYDTIGPAGAVRSRARADLVRVDGHHLLTGVAAFGDALRSLAVPSLLLTAPGGMFGDPPGFIPEPLVRHWAGQAPALRTELVADTNHYTIILAPAAAELVARRLTDPDSWPARD